MKILLRKASRTSIVIVSLMLIGMAISCTKQKSEPPGNPELIARADLNFVNDGELYPFKSYQDNSFKQVLLEKDTSLTLRFKNQNQNGNLVDEVVMSITLYNKNGFSAGQTYKATDNISNKTIWLHCTKPDGNYINYYAGNIFSGYNSGLAELEITSFDGINIIGNFSFTAYSTKVNVPEKKLVVTNGAFKCKVN